ASRLAGKLNRNWYAVYVQTPAEEATVIDSRTQRLLSGTLTLAKELGAMVFTYKGEDIVGTILRFAHEYRVGHIVLGSPAPIPFWRRIWGRRTIPERLMEEVRGMTVVILDTRPQGPVAGPAVREESVRQTAVSPRVAEKTPFLLSSLLNEGQIILWKEPVDRETVLERLVRVACPDCRQEEVLRAVRAREAEGSTFFNEGVAFPHARLAGLTKPLIALGLTRGGVTDAAVEKPVEYVFLSLTPQEKPEIQIQLLALAARTLQNRHLSLALHAAADAREVKLALKSWEESPPAPTPLPSP
ncbi:MAG: PTS sugar transporter subunit IIA, partial [Deltaproteobacteria bacterium]|nr:PTS sugar transporter subunit IIA [Deltaproteobacteria bacterium]